MSGQTRTNVIARNHEFYKITVKKLGNDLIDRSTYAPFLGHCLQHNMRIVCMTYELDSKGIIHLHALGRARVHYYCQNLQLTGFHVHVHKLNYDRYSNQDASIVDWMKYMFKDYDNSDIVKAEDINEIAAQNAVNFRDDIQDDYIDSVLTKDFVINFD